MDRFSKLEAFLAELLANPNPDSSLVSHLQLQLERARPEFKKLLTLPPKSTKEREQLNKSEFIAQPRLESWRE